MERTTDVGLRLPGAFANPLRLNLSNLVQSGKYSDLTVTCGSHTRQLHKAVVCAQSSVFAAMCDGPFKVSSHQPPNTRIMGLTAGRRRSRARSISQITMLRMSTA